MKIKVKEAADLVGGTIIGSPETTFSKIAKIETAAEGDLTLLYLPAYIKFLETTKASVTVIKTGFEQTNKQTVYIVVEDPGKAVQQIVETYFKPEFNLTGIDGSAFVHPDAIVAENVGLGKNVVISAGCRIGSGTKIYHNTVIMENCTIGEDCLIHSNVSIREETEIGNRVIIHSNTAVGSDGFGYKQDGKGVYKKIPQIGNVILEDDVELGSNVSVDRAAFGSTIIKKGAKIDNLVQVAHNVSIGENTAISGQSGISGSTKIGNNCILAGQVGLAGHIEIADGVIIGAQSGTAKSITKAGMYFGSPLKEIKTAFKLEAHVKNLPVYAEKIKKLEEKIAQLEKEKSKE